jgi:hypothetical protein
VTLIKRDDYIKHIKDMNEGDMVFVCGPGEKEATSVSNGCLLLPFFLSFSISLTSNGKIG